MAQPAKQRKRDAVGNLRDLAEELGMDMEARKKPDMSEADFVELRGTVLSHAQTPQHRERAADALKQFKGQLPPLGELHAC